MKLAANDVSAVKIGSTDVNKVYLGSNLVWEKAGLLLDDYPNASVAYSLRKLRTAYTGSAIKVRRSSDNTEQDIGFVGNELDTSSLLSFVGAGDGFVSKWYDQSGAGNDALQSTASNQPLIVSSGSVILNEGNTSISFDGVDDSLVFTQITLISVFALEDVLVSVGRGFLTNTSNSNVIGYGATSSVRRIRVNNINYEFSGLLGGNTVNSVINTGGNVSYYTNSLASSDNPRAIPSAMNFNSLMNRQGSLPISGFLNEIILYPSDQSSNRVAIENNINTHYTIY
jgi:hypothetical protein